MTSPATSTILQLKGNPVMKRVRFKEHQRWARANPAAPQFISEPGKVMELDEETIAEIPKDQIEILGDVGEETEEEKETEAAKSDASTSHNADSGKVNSGKPWEK